MARATDGQFQFYWSCISKCWSRIGKCWSRTAGDSKVICMSYCPCSALRVLRSLIGQPAPVVQFCSLIGGWVVPPPRDGVPFSWSLPPYITSRVPSVSFYYVLDISLYFVTIPSCGGATFSLLSHAYRCRNLQTCLHP